MMTSASAIPSRSTADALQDYYAVSVDVAANVLGIGKNSAYRAVKAGQIPSIRIGGRLLVPTAQLRKLLGLEGVS